MEEMVSNEPIPQDVQQFIQESDRDVQLTTVQMEKLWYTFRKLEQVPGTGITYEDFKKEFEIRDETFARRLFNALDTNKSGNLSYDELLHGLSALHVDAGEEEKLEFLTKLYELNGEEIDMNTFVGLLKESLRNNRLPVKESHIHGVASILFQDRETRNLRELFQEYGVTSDDLTIAISSSMQMYLQRCKTLSHLDEDIDKDFSSQTKRSKFQNWFHYSIVKRYHHPAAWPFIILYVLINLGLMFWQIFATMSWSVFEVLGWSVVVSRAAAGMLLFNCAIVIILASKHVLTSFRKIPFLFKTIPFDLNINAHRVVGWTILALALIHAGAHYRNFHILSNASLEVINEHLSRPWTSTKTMTELIFTDYPGITGHLMLLWIAIAYPFAALRKRGFQLKKAQNNNNKSAHNSLKVSRDHHQVDIDNREELTSSRPPWMSQSLDKPAVKKEHEAPTRWQSFWTFFNLFYLTHRGFIAFYICLLAHGFGYYLSGPNFFWWFILPAIIYGANIIMAFITHKYQVTLQKGRILASSVVMVQFPKPEGFKYFPGQYMYIKCEELSHFEYHPFSFTSAPNQDYLSAHIAVRGAWTSRLYELIDTTRDKQSLHFSIDGPYGAPAQHFGKYRTVVLFGAGIGVTPFASILRELLLVKKDGTDKLYPKVERVYFYWTARDHRNFEWFDELLNKLAVKNDKFKVHNYLTGVQSPTDMRNALLQLASNITYNEVKRCFVTGSKIKTHFGRPNLKAIIEHLAQTYGEHKIGVFACGPPAMTKELNNICSVHQKVIFHKENF